jgi:PIN domain nuclease of toxin-antitoxin system
MKLLLDTCALLWALHEPKKLSAKARKSLIDPANSIHVSAVSFWEISLKASIGKLELKGVGPEDFPGMVQTEGWEISALDALTASSFHALSRIDGHKDPFDRMLIHLAIHKGFHLVSKDASVDDYAKLGLRVCW